MKKTIAGIILTLAITAAQAEEPQAPVSPSEYTLKVTAAELVILGNGLGSQPFKDVQPLMNKLSAQVAEQNAAAQPKPEAKKK